METPLPSCIQAAIKQSDHTASTRRKKKDYGQKAKDTSTLIAGRNVEVETKDADQYGRTVDPVGADGHSLNELLIQNGFARVERQYCKEHCG
jgi:endonuclease YncB( thermonuclease family)